jgi:Fe2+ transport system protein B
MWNCGSSNKPITAASISRSSRRERLSSSCMGSTPSCASREAVYAALPALFWNEARKEGRRSGGLRFYIEGIYVIKITLSGRRAGEAGPSGSCRAIPADA